VRVLFVDDSPLARAKTGKLIVEKGIDVTVCSSLEEAKKVDTSSISAALLDLEIGDATGADLAGALRTTQPALPIAFLTATSSGDLYERARAFGPVFDKLSELEKAIGWLLTLV
jgi:DNA-binding response OmpR family regulator